MVMTFSLLFVSRPSMPRYIRLACQNVTSANKFVYHSVSALSSLTAVINDEVVDR